MPMKPFQILCACSLLLCAATSLWAQDPFPPVITSDSEHTLTEPLADDATLHDVRFVDAEFGWAVGDHGVVLHTSDGGQHWHRQRTPVEGDLQGVWFLDRLHGWCVGGTTLPYLWTSQAIVLSTKDGGKSWRQELAFVPALEQVKFFDLQHGVAWGRGSGADPFGLFASDDQGKNWRPVAVGLPGCWRGGDFVELDPDDGTELGRWSVSDAIDPARIGRSITAPCQQDERRQRGPKRPMPDHARFRNSPHVRLRKRSVIRSLSPTALSSSRLVPRLGGSSHTPWG